jgi:hypothetical protein
MKFRFMILLLIASNSKNKEKINKTEGKRTERYVWILRKTCAMKAN